MIILNFSHPLTPEQIAKIEELSNRKVEQVIALATTSHTRSPLSRLPK